MYAVSLREPLPKIRIPLRPGDVDAVLDLQSLVREAYVRGRYRSIDYTVPADPPLTGEDDSWADALLKEHGKRPSENHGKS